jgi:hypothetical protein
LLAVAAPDVLRAYVSMQWLVLKFNLVPIFRGKSLGLISSKKSAQLDKKLFEDLWWIPLDAVTRTLLSNNIGIGKFKLRFCWTWNMVHVSTSCINDVRWIPGKGTRWDIMSSQQMKEM